jgi:hypothetical protein
MADLAGCMIGRGVDRVFFPEADDEPELRRRYDDLNLKVNEYL